MMRGLRPYTATVHFEIFLLIDLYRYLQLLKVHVIKGMHSERGHAVDETEAS